MATTTTVKAKAAKTSSAKSEELPKDLLDILACPMCKGDLDYYKVKCILHCAKCRYNYPIKEGIPIMLPPDENEDGWHDK